MEQPTTIKLSGMYKPQDHQLPFHLCNKPYRAIIGGIGSGKSIGGCGEALIQGLRNPGTVVLIGRMYYTELNDTTKPIFMEEVLDPRLIAEESKQDNWVKLKPMGPDKLQTKFIFRALEDLYKVKSMNLGGAFIDEINEANEDVHYELSRRLRHKRGPGRLWVAGEDEGRNWVYHFYHPNGNKYDKRLSAIFVWPTRANRYLPQGFIEKQYASMPQEMIDRYLEPKFELLGGAVYKEWDPQVHVVKAFKIPVHWPIYRVIDPGVTNVTCCLWYAVDEAGTYYFIDEFYQEDVTVELAAKTITQMSHRWEKDRPTGITYTLIDPAAFRKTYQKYGRNWSIADEYNEQGIFAIPASNDINAGIIRVRQMLHLKQIKVFPICESLIEEFPDYGWRKFRGKITDDSRREKPMHVRCHALDCVRYAVSDGSQSAIKPIPYIDRWYFRDNAVESDWMLEGFMGVRK